MNKAAQEAVRRLAALIGEHPKFQHANAARVCEALVAYASRAQLKEVAAATETHQTTIRRWVNIVRMDPDLTEAYNVVKRVFISEEMLEAGRNLMGRAYREGMTQSIGGMKDVRDLAVVAGIATDKAVVLGPREAVAEAPGRVNIAVLVQLVQDGKNIKPVVEALVAGRKEIEAPQEG